MKNAKTDAGFAAAYKIYSEGGYSKSVATIKLTSALSSNLAKGATVSQGTISGKLYKAGSDADTTIEVQYISIGCHVGGLPAPETDGCKCCNGASLDYVCCITSNSVVIFYTGLAASGDIVIGTTTFAYDGYNATVDTYNGRTIQGFSTSADTKMRGNNDNDPYFADFQKFFDYYGSYNYADEWITNAFGGGSTNFKNGDADFSKLTFTGKGECAMKGTAYMSVFMYVIRELEDAVYDKCVKQCAVDQCNDDAVNALDEAVAFYTGSLEGTDGTGDGNLIYNLADKRAGNYKTAGLNGDEITGTAKVNYDIFMQFDKFRAGITGDSCPDVIAAKERIVQLMFVPMIQGTLRYAYKRSSESGAGEKEEAEGAVFAAGVLPMVHACNANDALTIYTEMKVGSGGDTDFPAVKKAFEKNYKCLGVTGEDIGGLFDTVTDDYYPGAGPLVNKSVGAGLVVGTIFGVVGGLAVIGGAFFIMRRRKGGIEMQS